MLNVFKNIALANWFLKRGIREGKLLTQMQVQKMVYFAHALSLADKNKPLVRGFFRAWKYGPVLPDLYAHTSHWGRTPITEPIMVPGLSLTQLHVPKVRDAQEIDILEITWKVFSPFIGEQLSNISHAKDGPWDRCWADGKGEGAVIPNELIKSYYEQRLVEDDR